MILAICLVLQVVVEMQDVSVAFVLALLLTEVVFLLEMERVQELLRLLMEFLWEIILI